jgi:hypothetical protein
LLNDGTERWRLDGENNCIAIFHCSLIARSYTGIVNFDSIRLQKPIEFILKVCGGVDNSESHGLRSLIDPQRTINLQTSTSKIVINVNPLCFLIFYSKFKVLINQSSLRCSNELPTELVHECREEKRRLNSRHSITRKTQTNVIAIINILNIIISSRRPMFFGVVVRAFLDEPTLKLCYGEGMI